MEHNFSCHIFSRHNFQIILRNKPISQKNIYIKKRKKQNRKNTKLSLRRGNSKSYLLVFI